MLHRQFRSIALLLAVVGFVAVPRAEAQSVGLIATDASVTVTEGVIDATFRLEVTNTSETPVSNLSILMPDGTSLWLGEIGAKQSVKSASESHRFDISGKPVTHNMPIAVTLNYAADGAEVEELAMFVLRPQQQ